MPSDDGIERVIHDLLATKGWRCAEDLQTVATRLSGLSVAIVHAVLQSALNAQATRVARNGQRVEQVIEAESLQRALGRVVPEIS